ncbi:NuoC-like protein [Aeropyrum camini SY1 = JCM 12091]|uniref:NuoC-like protein n=1 Tax=Aeropyrum camini SY1 = JCM 12091 TaxID=1198449 RepID=U3TE98_9CREN|nr:NuoC-like protein [Aeropyrum camini SY1 = JCM 12091]
MASGDVAEEGRLASQPRDAESTLAKAVEMAEKALREIGVEFRRDEGKGFVDFIVSVDDLVKAAEALKAAGFDHVVSVTAVDYPKERKFRVVYHVSSYLDPHLKGAIVGLGVEIPRVEKPSMPSLSQVWVSAEFQEREVYEFFGIEFEGHTDLRPLLLTPPVAEKRPLRKDFVVREESIYEGVPKEWSKA